MKISRIGPLTTLYKIRGSGHKKLILFLWEDVETSLVLLGLRFRLLNSYIVSMENFRLLDTQMYARKSV
jgi:hypothetical protein